MPTYAGKAYKTMNGELVLFQIPSKGGASPYYYRINLPEQKRIESLVANAFKADAARYMALRQPYPYSDPCNPPAQIIDAAIQIYNDMRARMVKGLPIVVSGSKNLVEACKGSIKEAEIDVASGVTNPIKVARRKAFYERYVYPYSPFKDPVTAINSGVLKEWQHWRDRYWISGEGQLITQIETEKNGKIYRRTITKKDRRIPTLSTKNTEWIHLKNGFDWAARQGWIEIDLIPRHYFRRTQVGDADKNPAFTPSLWESLEKKAQEWINKDKLRGDNKRVRQLCWWFALVCRAYGLRTAECYALRKRHLVIAGDVVKLSIGAIKTKSTGKHERTIDPIFKFRQKMFSLFTKELPAFYQKQYGRPWRDEDPIWMHNDGQPIRKFYRGFDSLLHFAGITEDPQGHNYNFTSLRHTTITEFIETTNLSTGLIAIWAGTSSQMIDKTYNQSIMRRAHFLQTRGEGGPATRDDFDFQAEAKFFGELAESLKGKKP